MIYRSLTWRRLLKVSMETIETTAVILLIVAGASIFAWILTSNQVTQHVVTLLGPFADNPIATLIIINLVLIVVGCFMETIAAITILVPVLLPVAVTAGVDPVHFGVIMVLNLMIGLLTPPVGMVLYVLSRVSGISLKNACVARCRSWCRWSSPCYWSPSFQPSRCGCRHCFIVKHYRGWPMVSQ
ncbi:hypothetical protein HORIV_59690 [Vreelandella olivaria]|uniref:TRAP C4-dicarboxylate transport system permease DctM subunit domain-containing protein n=1 Tax=Vreelandella olivaria TaxID=390919 RepID=A0ABM7GS90_9GAMM|nr:hypothetical protein HORIV_59690 [Halomonas olivaria]